MVIRDNEAHVDAEGRPRVKTWTSTRPALLDEVHGDAIALVDSGYSTLEYSCGRSGEQ